MRSNSTMIGNDVAMGTTTHVWVRTELVEALVKYNGSLSPGWKLSTSRKRARTVSAASSNNHNNFHQQQQRNTNQLRTEVQEAWGWLRARMAPVSTKEYGSPPPSPARRSSLSGGSNRSLRMSSGSPRMAPGSPFSSRRHDKLKKLQSNRRVNRGVGGDNNSTGSDELTIKKNSRPCTITVDDDESSPLQLQHVTVTVPSELTSDPNLFCMANTWWRQPDAAPPDDLTLLTHLHEPSVVYCLQRRYEQNAIYTYTGKILIALNPFCSIPRIYDESVMQQYWIRGSSQLVELPPLPPHVYAVAQDAYGSMIRDLQEQQYQSQQQQRRHMAPGKENQSILVSGESGAGKTVTTKIIMRYLATLSKQSHQQGVLSEQKQGKGGADVSIESQVLQSNPILESFGNARTIRNDNSSRFGKFIEIQFLSSGCLVSAAITTYLLEKVRLISQAPGERNYHVFYELMAGVSHQDRRTLGLSNASPSSFRMTALSGTFDRRDGVDDRENYRILRSAMDTVGFTKLEQSDLLSVACALLHASNLTFRETKSDLVELDPSNSSLQPTLSLLGVTSGALNNALCLCAIEAAGETVHKRLSVSQANKALEALMKATYGALFDHIVCRINNSITVRQKLDDASVMNGNQVRSASIGVLDIFGFESFETNSYEQLCINYCNEALQQQFNRFVFKLEQEEYAREGIEWSFISFPDNQDVLDLVEAKHGGILSLLDEQCRLQRCTDATFARAVYEKCHKHPRFEATDTQKVNARFSIHHYAGLVEYDTSHFLEKNKDELPKETTELLMSSAHALVSRLGKSLKELPTRSKSPLQQRDKGGKKPFHRASSSILRESVGSQFSSQLRELRTRIEFTTPHYVRCIKPNDDLVPHNFNPLIIADQLRCAGVLEAVRVSRIGFPQRYPHASFLERYSILALNGLKQYSRLGKGRGLCEVLLNSIVPRILEILNGDSTQEYGSMHDSKGSSSTFLGIQIGLSKVFLRQKAFDALEMLRSRKLEKAATIIQAYVRRLLSMRYLVKSLMAILVLQSFVRKAWAVRQVQNMRRNMAATVVQALWRRFKAEKSFVAALLIALWCQSAQRRWVAKQLSAIMKIEREALVIQRTWRRYRQIGYFTRSKLSAIRIQCAFRVYMAKRQFLVMRQAARDLRIVAAERDRFRTEALRLRNELNQLRNAPRAESSPASSVAMDDTEVLLLKSEIDKLKQELASFQQIEPPPSSILSHDQRTVAETRDAISDIISIRDTATASGGMNRLSPYDTDPKRIPALNDNQNLTSEQSSPIKMSVMQSPSKMSVLTSMFSFSFGRFSPLKSPRSENITSPARSISTKSLLDSENDEVGGMLMAMTVSPMNDASDSVFQGRRNFGSFDRALKRNESRDSAFRAQFDALSSAVLNNSTHELEDLLRQSTETHVLVNECDDRGRTILHLAAQSGNIKIAKLLLEHGAIVNSQDDEGETPIHLSSSASMVMFLLEEGIGANANIPNADGVCLLHLAVQRRDIESVRGLLRHSADVNSADNIRWFTPLHLVALPARNGAGDDISEDTDDARDVRVRIAQLLCGATNQVEPDLNYQDSEGNTPLHYAVQIISEEARDIVDVFLENGADPKVTNNRGQSPLHLLLHNEFLRRLDMTQQILHLLLYHGADPNQQSMTGCTSLHLTLYHKDIDGAVQLMNSGAELHLVWKKPRHWATFWNDHGMSDVLALDMIEDGASLHRLLAAITRQQQWAPTRPWCMNCQLPFGPFGRTLHCRHCGRLVCGSCTRRTLGAECFPKSFEVYEASWVCIVCDKILVARKEDESHGTQPISSIDDDEEDRSYF